MDITTNFKVGDTVWYLNSVGVQRGVIDSIDVFIALNTLSVKYHLTNNAEILEAKAFRSKQELIESL